jgi:hypothetical protein
MQMTVMTENDMRLMRLENNVTLFKNDSNWENNMKMIEENHIFQMTNISSMIKMAVASVRGC